MKNELQPRDADRRTLERLRGLFRGAPLLERLELNSLEAEKFNTDSGFAGALGGFVRLEPNKDGIYVIEAPKATIKRIKDLLEESAGA